MKFEAKRDEKTGMVSLNIEWQAGEDQQMLDKLNDTLKEWENPIERKQPKTRKKKGFDS